MPRKLLYWLLYLGFRSDLEQTELTEIPLLLLWKKSISVLKLPSFLGLWHCWLHGAYETNGTKKKIHLIDRSFCSYATDVCCHGTYLFVTKYLGWKQEAV